uniref:Uncharacterized protein n=1 Tax=Panstrongylus lignarius TaxID=156445 RepID=A0A224Y1K1_9HEMI
MDTSGSFKHSKIVVLCLCTALVSTCTVLSKVFKATYLIFLSLFSKKRPRIFIAKTRRPLSERISIIDNTVSYNIVFPTFLLVSVLVATCAKISFIASDASTSFLPNILSNRSILT